MYKYIDGRGTGKTRKLLQTAKDDGGIVICGNPYAMERKAAAYGIVGVTCLGYSAFPQETKGKKVYIDELDNFLRYMDNGIFGYTLSVGDDYE